MLSKIIRNRNLYRLPFQNSVSFRRLSSNTFPLPTINHHNKYFTSTNNKVDTNNNSFSNNSNSNISFNNGNGGSNIIEDKNSNDFDNENDHDLYDHEPQTENETENGLENDHDAENDLDGMSFKIPKRLKFLLEKSKFNEHQSSDILLSFFEENHQTGIPYLIYSEETVQVLVKSYLELDRVESAIFYLQKQNSFKSSRSFEAISEYFIKNNQKEQLIQFMKDNIEKHQFSLDYSSYIRIFRFIPKVNNLNKLFKELVEIFLSKECLISDLITAYIFILKNKPIFYPQINTTFSQYNKYISDTHKDLIMSSLILIAVKNKNIPQIKNLVNNCNQIDLTTFQTLAEYLIDDNNIDNNNNKAISEEILNNIKSKINPFKTSLLIYYNESIKKNDLILNYLLDENIKNNKKVIKLTIQLYLLEDNTQKAIENFISVIDSHQSPVVTKEMVRFVNELADLFVTYYLSKNKISSIKFWRKLTNKNNQQNNIDNDSISNQLLMELNILKQLKEQNKPNNKQQESEPKPDQNQESEKKLEKQLDSAIISCQIKEINNFLKENYFNNKRDVNNLKYEQLIEIFELIISSNNNNNQPSNLQLYKTLLESLHKKSKLLFDNHNYNSILIKQGSFNILFKKIDNNNELMEKIFNIWEQSIKEFLKEYDISKDKNLFNSITATIEKKLTTILLKKEQDSIDLNSILPNWFENYLKKTIDDAFYRNPSPSKKEENSSRKIITDIESLVKTSNIRNDSKLTQMFFIDNILSNPHKADKESLRKINEFINMDSNNNDQFRPYLIKLSIFLIHQGNKPILTNKEIEDFYIINKNSEMVATFITKLVECFLSNKKNLEAREVLSNFKQYITKDMIDEIKSSFSKSNQ
ncbi:hypothetical protein DICPUDRAFT_83638 [Dictyostelium purpureum]|uniref:Uncharacterized protein n=1 Tax=Dictyostelium purpureum TaxID=5786 RepID=F1A053_DICPU|nr:uncharacterized protein DICPUDRAFT_83638 [Dictyostelium purpureum]EGC30426.1 hypothetical protein DICPUDRAFT_83638 [Dictyostelium purpureum]|eukprot:XP_003293050.1 hypothetical protein DICPUDRAFT_83638 [Dictyostelium purpureum]